MTGSGQRLFARISPKRRQYLTLAGIGLMLFNVLWGVFAITEKPRSPGQQAPVAAGQARVTNVGVMAPGAQLDPQEAWIGDAGKDVAQLKHDRDEARTSLANQERFNRDLLERLESLKQDLAKGPRPAPASPTTEKGPDYPPDGALFSPSRPVTLPPPPPPPRQSLPTAGIPPASPSAMVEAPPMGLVRVALTDGAKAATATPNAAGSPETKAQDNARRHSVDNYLPVGFARAVLLGGLDAPTGGQSQTNPHPVLLRLTDDAVLPNRYRGQVRECFVIGAGYGDISSERAYIRTESLSCVRNDGSTLEAGIQGSVFGEDGKVGMRGRLVTKQGQLLANALIAGIVSGIGTGFQNYSSTTSASTFGTVSTVSPDKAFQYGVGNGVGKAMDRLANYYISLAEKIFPVIEVDAGRMVDVLFTKGVVIEAPIMGDARTAPMANQAGAQARLQRTTSDEDDD